jgi:hypothetical protein
MGEVQGRAHDVEIIAPLSIGPQPGRRLKIIAPKRAGIRFVAKFCSL